jgi:CRISPR/Cas system-associated exonuclease Cas4 (RecB family)
MTRAEQHLALTFSGNGKKANNWAKRLVESLQLPVEELGDKLIECGAAGGEPWKLLLRVVDRAPELLVGPPSARTSEAAPAKRIWLDAPEATGQQDTNAAVTELVEYSQCPRRYYLRHYLGFDVHRCGNAEAGADDGMLSATELGIQVHGLLAGIAVTDPDPNALRMADNFRKSALGRRAAKASRVEREFDFLMAVDGLVIRGQVDLWFEAEGELVIVDYKTGAHRATDADGHALQLRLYAMAVEQLVARAADRAYVHYLQPDVVVEVDLAPSLIDSPSELVREYQRAQDSLEFRMNEGEHCRRCLFFRGLCPATVEAR